MQNAKPQKATNHFGNEMCLYLLGSLACSGNAFYANLETANQLLDLEGMGLYCDLHKGGYLFSYFEITNVPLFIAFVCVILMSHVLSNVSFLFSVNSCM